MIYIARYKDGSCAIASTQDEATARELIESDDSIFDPEKDKIVSVRCLVGEFVTRWSFDHKGNGDSIQEPEFCGTLSDMLTVEVLDHEYPLLVEAHEFVTRAAGATDEQLAQHLRRAIELECDRFSDGHRTDA